jgi:hypothetical protein
MRESVIATRVLRGRARSHGHHLPHLREHAKTARAPARVLSMAHVTQRTAPERKVIEMKVRELIAVLEDLDPEAAVYIMSQPNYPFEHAVSGVALREDFTDCDDEDDEEAEGEEEERPAPARDRWTARDTDLPSTDVFILEGEQLRYGSREAWSARR